MGIFPEIISVTSPDSSEEIIEISRKTRKKEPFPGFSIFGNGKTTRFGGKSMDIIDIFQQLNKGEMELMRFFRDEMEDSKARDERNPNQVVPTKSENFGQYLRIALKKNFPHMECLGIVKRVKRGIYMLNPLLFIPAKRVEVIKDIWLDIDSKECK